MIWILFEHSKFHKSSDMGFLNFCFFFYGQLSACCVNVLAAAAAQVGSYALFTKIFGKSLNFILAGVYEAGKSYRIILDDIYLTGEVFAEFCKLGGILDV